MAVKVIEKGKVPLNGDLLMPTAVACGADGAVVEFDHPDEKIMLVIGTATATIKKGNALQGVKDLVVTFTAGTRCVVIESGAYVNVSGDNKGKILITGATATVSAVSLP